MEKGKNYVFERKQSKTCTFNISCNAQKRNYKVKGIFYFLSSLFFNIQKKRHCFLLFPNENSNFVQFAISVAYMSSLKIDTTKPSSKILCRNVSCEPREAKTYARLVFFTAEQPRGSPSESLESQQRKVLQLLLWKRRCFFCA